MARRLTYVTSRWGEPTQTFVRREAAALRRLGIDVRALSMKRPHPTGTGIDVRHLRPHGVVLGVLTSFIRRPVRTMRLLGSVLLRAQPGHRLPLLAAAAVGAAWFGRGAVGREPLHAHFGWVTVVATWAAGQLAGVPHSVVLHAFELHRGDRQDPVCRRAVRAASKVFVISERDVELVRQGYEVEPVLLRMGVPRSWLAESPPGEGLVSVGSLLPKKGHEVLLHALALTAHPWRLTIIGEGPGRRSLEELREALGLEDRVELVGRLEEDEVRSRVSAAAVFCLASVVEPNGDRDGIPVALIEAMALGLPVVSTDVGGIPELVGGAGMVVPAGDAWRLAAALDALADGSLRSEMGRRGRDRVRDGWVVDDHAAAVAALAR